MCYGDRFESELSLEVWLLIDQVYGKKWYGLAITMHTINAWLELKEKLERENEWINLPRTKSCAITDGKRA